ncbi:hypothetical protein AWZ03_014597, partial [Drosophila navojoa]
PPVALALVRVAMAISPIWRMLSLAAGDAPAAPLLRWGIAVITCTSGHRRRLQVDTGVGFFVPPTGWRAAQPLANPRAAIPATALLSRRKEVCRCSIGLLGGGGVGSAATVSSAAVEDETAASPVAAVSGFDAPGDWTPVCPPGLLLVPLQRSRRPATEDQLNNNIIQQYLSIG